MGPITNRHPLQYEKPSANTSVTWVHGNHTYKAGAELRIESNSSTLFAATDGQFTFSPNETALPYLQSSSLGGGTVGFSYASFFLGQERWKRPASSKRIKAEVPKNLGDDPASAIVRLCHGSQPITRQTADAVLGNFLEHPDRVHGDDNLVHPSDPSRQLSSMQDIGTKFARSASGREWIMGNIARPPCDEATILAGSCGRPATTDGPWILAATVLGSSMAFIDGTVVNVALPALQSALHANLSDVQWVVESYALFLAALLLIGGSLGDL